MTPGRNPSSTTSAVSTSRRIRRLLSSSVRSTATDFLPRLWGRNSVGSGGRPGRTAVMCRAASPPGASTLITSAPRSASTCPASGPAMFWVKSSTRYPSSGLAGLLFGMCGLPLCGPVQHRGAVVIAGKRRILVGGLRRQSVVAQQLIQRCAHRAPAAVPEVGRHVVALAGEAQVLQLDVEAVLLPLAGGRVQRLQVGAGIHEDLGQ